ncbi:Chaperonin-like RbcX protein 2, chloroplastic [Sesamum alatum]|uniref:Chaperonin-like RbcX protein 2, chloroplastic n=1 Tax=Sesamum alatum TaxID=300844 RepID=A0AAE1Z3D1_9LAMI|nr:Chaperonin-like RbcX protein 2, chloroplastic [Sesamum alatum]
MVGAVSVVGSSLVDGKVCLDAAAAMSSSHRHFVGRSRKHVRRLGSLELRSSFLDYSSVRALLGSKNLRKQRKNRSLVVVAELLGQYEDSFEDVKEQILYYFTYKAVRTVLNQLYEMNPIQYRWLYNFVASNEVGYGKHFIRNLGKEQHELAERVMVTRLHLYGKWIKKCDHTEMYERISDQNLELMRERLMETVIWPSDDSNTEVVG